MRRWILLVPLGLCACNVSGDRAAANRAVREQSVGTGSTPAPNSKPDRSRTPAPAANIVPASAPASTGPGAAAATASVPPRIPSAIRGRWGLNPADCKGDAAAKGLLTIDARQMRFYEARATIGRIIASSPQRLEAEFKFTGEGQTWTLTQTLDATTNTLRRRAGGDEPVDLLYTRCPA